MKLWILAPVLVAIVVLVTLPKVIDLLISVSKHGLRELSQVNGALASAEVAHEQRVQRFERILARTKQLLVSAIIVLVVGGLFIT